MAAGNGAMGRRPAPQRKPPPPSQQRRPTQRPPSGYSGQSRRGSQQRKPASGYGQSRTGSQQRKPRGSATTYPQRRRPQISREEALRRQEMRRLKEEREAQMRAESEALAKGPVDLPFCLLVMLLTAVGLVMLLSASFPSAYYESEGKNPTAYFNKQALFDLMGIAAMFFISKFNYQRFRGAGKILMYVSVFLLVLVAIPHNPLAKTINGSTRWLGVPGTPLQFQPSEIAKMAVIIYFSDTISRKMDKMHSFRQGVAPYAACLILIAGLVAIEPHLSGAILILGAGAALMLVGGINWAWVIGAGGLGALLMWFAVFVVGYNSSRIEYWLNPWADAQDKGYQLSQSLITIGSGGLLGVGLGKSRQKFLYLPEEHNDFIFAIICEELGLIGAGLIMMLFAALILRGYWISLHAKDRFGSLLVVGVITLVAVQTFLNIAVVTGFLPTTGISLPFFSYGGTALTIQLAEMGIVLSVSRQMRPVKSG